MLLPNGTIHRDKLLLERALKDPEGGFKTYSRGFLVSVDDASLWYNCLECFSSIPATNEGLEHAEMWFSLNHTHDYFSVHLDWDGDRLNNTHVNLDRRVADERGSKFLVINPAKYNGTEKLVLNVLQDYWMINQFWVNFFNTFYSLSFIILILFASL